MILLIVLFLTLLALLRVVGEVVFERAFPLRTLPLFLIFTVITLYALVTI